ncbi:MAG: Smr/MutS family protein [Bacteroidia bacterium]|nr:Smr/MutS family protein [Bacteroidia bacterium]MDW8235457.1 Smr/MutS family protein [Bacteroidia bacterium]
MLRARLLHSPEWVDVLSIDTLSQKAVVRRQGFVQTIPLQEVVLEEAQPATPQASSSSCRESQILLQPKLTEDKATLHLHHAESTSAFYALYIRERKGTWRLLLHQLLHSGETVFLSLSLQEYPPPWRLIWCRLTCPSEPVAVPPHLQRQEIEMRYADFTRAEAPRFSLKEREPASSPAPSEDNLPPLPEVYPDEEIDLHIEKLAPSLVEESPDTIFRYQVDFLERYLWACVRAGRHTTRVIHGIGKKRLQEALLSLCRENGWRTEVLFLPPYKGGATQVVFK